MKKVSKKTFKHGQTLCGAFAICSRQRHSSGVDLDSGNDAVGLEQLHHHLAAARLLVERLVEEDDAADVFGQVLAAREQQLAVGASVVLDVFHVDLRQTLSDRCCRTTASPQNQQL